ncbi:MAG: CARDB domain-containing protein, partial [candidate division NC10 bacterium]|nr:CARDB domain-containing protein [candidate division NC10 bacterium]
MKRGRKVFLEPLEPRLLLSGDPTMQVDPVMEVEDNNTPSMATFLPLTEDPVGSGLFLGWGLGAQDPARPSETWSDPDYWRIEAQAGDILSVSVDTPESAVDPYVELRSATDGGLRGEFDSGPGGDAFISHYVIPSSGTYYIKVGQYSGSPVAGSYQLRVDLARGTQLETDGNYSNDSVSGANQLKLTGRDGHSAATVAGTIMSPEGSNTDEDLFGWGTLSTGNIVELSVANPSGSTLSPRVTLVNNSGVALPDGDNNVNDGHVLATLPANGAYYAKVEALSGAGPSAQYLLDVEVTDLIPPRILSVSALPSGGGATDDPIASFAVTVSEDLDPATVGLGLRQVWTYGGHFYLLTEGGLSWTAAEAQAQALGGHLVTVNDAAEQQWLWQTFGGFGNLWIGFTDQAVEGTWVWADGSAVSYTNWQTGHPYHYDPGYDYANMEGVTGKWRNTDTSSLRGLLELPGLDGDADGLPDTVDPYPNDPLNAWDLRAVGSDGVFDTTDDVIYRLTLAAPYTVGTKVQLFIEAGPLPSGSYRFTGNRTLRDRAGNPLDGNGDGTGGDPYQQFFDVALPVGMTLEGGTNNTLPAATFLPLTEDPVGSGLFLGWGLGAQDPARPSETWSDPDYWRIEAQAGDILSVSVDTPESAVDPYVELRSATDGGLRGEFDSGPGGDAFISHYVIPSSGTYYIKVGQYSGSPVAGSYQLRVDLARGTQLETDGNYSNDSVSGANAVSFQAIGTHRMATIAGTIMSPEGSNTDEDYFKLGAVQAGETIFLSLRLPESSSLVPVAEVRKSNSTVVAIAPNPLETPARVDVTSADTYYAVVRATAGEGSHGQYLLDAAIWPSGELDFADLGVADMTVPANASSGEEIHIAWTVGNLGTGVTNAVEWHDRIVLSGNDKYGDADDIPLASVQHTGALDVGSEYGAEADVRLPLGIAGNYRLFVETDQNNAVFEYLFENNNIGQSSSPLAIALTPSADLETTNVVVPAIGVAGEPTNLSWTVTNAGTGTTGDGTPGGTVEVWTDRFVLSSNAIYGDADDRLVAEIPRTGALDAGSSYGGSFTGALPEGLSGKYFVFVFTDATDTVYEQDNTHSNLARSEGTITIASAAFADLTVSEVTAPSSAVVGEPILVQWVAANTDNAWGATPASQWYDQVVLSQDEIFGNADDRALGEFLHAGPVNRSQTYSGSATVSIPSNLNGRYYLFVSLDSRNSVYEYSYGGNNLSAPLAVDITGPDLVVESVVAPASAQFGQAIDISWTVRNVGNEAASGAWSDRLWLSQDGVLNPDDTLLLTRAAGAAPVSIGSEYPRSASVTLPLNASVAEGPHFIIVQTDGLGTQPESADTNNTGRSEPLLLTLPPLPDLVVSDIMAPVEAISGQKIPVSWTLTNQGMEGASGTWTDYVYLSSDPMVGGDQLLGAFPFTGSIAPGQSVSRTQEITLPMDLQGQHWVIVLTDGQNQVFEHASDSNNTTVDDQAIETRLAPIPNLQVSSVTPPATAFSGQETLVEWQVTNTGTGATSASYWYDVVYLSPDLMLDETDVFLGQSTNASYLGVGESYRNSMTVRLPRGIDGNYFFLVKTDASNQVFELGNEGDNVGTSGSMRVQLAPPPDLQVASVQAPSQAFSGQPMTLSWTIVNQGEVETPETAWYDLVYMSADDALDGSDRLLGQVYHSGGLDSGESYTASRVVTLPIGVSGDFFLLVRADGLGQVYEHAFEENNVGHDATPTHVNLTPPPDLVMEEVTAPTTALASHPLTISYRVTNLGSMATPNSSWTDSFYLSADDALDPATDHFLGDRTHFGALEVDGSYTNTATFTLHDGLSGTFYAFVVTDWPGNLVFELDNSNNTAMAPNTISVESHPADLVIDTASNPSSGTAGGSIRVEWTVRNLGMGDTAVDTWKDLVIASADAVLGGADDVTLLSVDHSGLLNGGESYTRNELVKIPFELAGQYQLFIVTDVNHTVYEGANDGNNVSQALPITITRQTSDLQVTALDAPDSAMAGTSLPVSWRVENLGSNRTNSYYWYDRAYLSQDRTISEEDRELGFVRRSNPLDPAGAYDVSTTFIIPADLSGGTYYVVVRTDSDNLVLEDPLDEQNNDRSFGPISITPAPAPDLVLGSVEVPTEGISGQAFPLTWTVRNDGDPTGDRTWYDAVYLSRDQIFDPESDLYLGYRDHVGGLATGESYSASQAFTVPNGLSGPFYVFVATDRGSYVDGEASELNNAGYDGTSMLVTLAPPADLVVGEITIPANAVPGCEATIGYSIRNEGDNEAIGTWFDSIYISADESWDLDDPLFGRVQHTGDVAADASYSESLTAPLPGITPGDYHVIIRSDIRNHVRESNEGNNIGASLDQVSIDLQALALGTPATGTLGQGQSAHYRVDVEAGETLIVSLDSLSADASNELYLRYGEMPTRAEFDFAFSVP